MVPSLPATGGGTEDVGWTGSVALILRCSRRAAGLTTYLVLNLAEAFSQPIPKLVEKIFLLMFLRQGPACSVDQAGLKLVVICCLFLLSSGVTDI